MLIRLSQQNDINAVDQSYRDLLLHEAQTGISHTNWVLDVYPTHATAEKAHCEGTLYVLEHCGEICASMILNQHQAEVYEKIHWEFPAPMDRVLVLHTLCIPPRHAGKGLGTAMVEYALSAAREKNCCVLRLDTYAGNAPAASLYQKLGFRYAGKELTLHEGVISEELIFFEKQI